MPAKSEESIIRLFFMLKQIPVYPKSIPTKKLWLIVNDEFPVSKRTVERDLMKLSSSVDLTYKKSAEGNQWSFKSNSIHHFVPAISSEEALCLKLVEEHLKQYLPSQTFEKLNSLFNKSNQILDKSGALKKLPNLVRSVPQALKVLPSNINQVFVDTVFDALLKNNMLRIKYHENAKQYLIKPLGVLVRDYKLVLVCQYDGFDNVRNLLVHRLRKVEKTTFSYKHDFDLQEYINKQSAAVSLNKENILLSMEVKNYVKDLLSESVLAESQNITPINDTWSHVDISLPHTVELENWLLSQLHNIKIIGPKKLKERVIEKAKAAIEINS